MKIDKVAILVKKAALESEKRFNPVLAEYDLTTAQYKVLKFLYAQPSGTARVVDIERYYSMTHPTALGLLEQLEKKGFTVRVPNPDDARGKLAVLTEKAQAMQKDLETIGEALESSLTSRLTTRERTQLVRLLQKLLGLDQS